MCDKINQYLSDTIKEISKLDNTNQVECTQDGNYIKLGVLSSFRDLDILQLLMVRKKFDMVLVDSAIVSEDYFNGYIRRIFVANYRCSLKPCKEAELYRAEFLKELVNL